MLWVLSSLIHSSLTVFPRRQGEARVQRARRVPAAARRALAIRHGLSVRRELHLPMCRSWVLIAGLSPSRLQADDRVQHGEARSGPAALHPARRRRQVAAAGLWFVLCRVLTAQCCTIDPSSGPVRAGDLYGVGPVARQLCTLRLFAFNLNTRSVLFAGAWLVLLCGCLTM